jgi:dihydrofolate reductase
MSKLSVFENVTLDGYFSGPNGDISWAHRSDDEEWNKFVEENASSGEGILLFGRVTYDLMVQYWPTPQAAKNDPIIAERMNNFQKIVFSRTLDKPAWKNTTVVKGDIESEIQRLKDDGKDMTILGSGSIVSQLAQAGLIDEYQLSINPVVIGKGRTVFEGVKDKFNLKLTKTRNFKNGNVVLLYERA